MFFKGIPWTAHLSEQTETRPGERYQDAHKSSCFPLGQGQIKLIKTLLQTSPSQLPRPILALEQAAPFLPAPRTEPGLEDIQSESEPKPFTQKRKTAPFPSKLSPRPVPPSPSPAQTPTCHTSNGSIPSFCQGLLLLHLVLEMAGKVESASVVMKESWRELQAASRASTGASPRMAAGEEHQPSSNSSPPQTAPGFLPPFALLSLLPRAASAW